MRISEGEIHSHIGSYSTLLLGARGLWALIHQRKLKKKEKKHNCRTIAASFMDHLPLLPKAEMDTLLLLVTAGLLEFNNHDPFPGPDTKQIQERVSRPSGFLKVKLIWAVTFHEGSWRSTFFFSFFFFFFFFAT